LQKFLKIQNKIKLKSIYNYIDYEKKLKLLKYFNDEKTFRVSYSKLIRFKFRQNSSIGSSQRISHIEVIRP